MIYQLPVGGIGATKEEVKLNIPATPESKQTASMMARMFIAPDDLGTPAGAVTLRGAYNFQTPAGWDTVYTSIFNMIERPAAPALVIRVETDWYVHDTEFRYVLQPGETISASHSLPIGQAFFVPREKITLRDGTRRRNSGEAAIEPSVLRRQVGRQDQDRVRAGAQPALPAKEPAAERGSRGAGNRRNRRQDPLTGLSRLGSDAGDRRRIISARKATRNEREACYRAIYSS